MFNLSQNCPPAETSQVIGAERLLDQPRRTFGFVQNYLGQEQGGEYKIIKKVKWWSTYHTT